MTFFKKHINLEESKYKDLFYTYYSRVFIYIARKVQGKENVRDIAQEVFTHLWIYKKDLLLKTNPEAIIFNTCNQEISKFLKISETKIFPLFEDHSESTDSSIDTLSILFKKEEMLESLHNSINKLPPLRQKILKMNKLEGLTQEQIASQLQISPQTVKKHVSEALNFLKKQHENY